MTKLVCSATSCTYNKDKLCAKGDILVAGSDAEKSNETKCDSFISAGRDCYCNSSASGKDRIAVKCEAINCVFNENRACSAEHIGIAGQKAHSSSETECSSFQKR
ncbi:MAG: DUF1540 domain-containing protein [Lachnospiraceae bacterium]|nr:DUF1540 domain-containing protein [Lachnospiraceae bacterium]